MISSSSPRLTVCLSLNLSLSLSLSLPPVPEEGGSGLDGAPHLYYSIPVVPPRGWPVLQLLSLLATGQFITAVCMSELYKGIYIYRNKTHSAALSQENN